MFLHNPAKKLSPSYIRLILQYLPAFIPSLLVIAGNLYGGLISASNMFFTLVVLVILDFLVLENRSRNNFSGGLLSDSLLIMAVMFHLVCLMSLWYGIFSHRVCGGWIWIAAVSTGLNAGLLGLNTAHELIHRKNRLLKNLGILNLFLCCYGHFYVEHRMGHHARVGTAEDPATARQGEGFYRFLFRTIPGQWLSAHKLARRQTKSGSLSENFVIRASMAEALFVAILLIIRAEAGFAFLLSSLVAVFLLEYVNYIEHYGLIRKAGEKPAAVHSWQSDSQLSRFHLFELSRHSHHHMEANVPYPELESMESPRRLPFGYFGMFYIALLPPLWFYVMDKRLN